MQKLILKRLIIACFIIVICSTINESFVYASADNPMVASVNGAIIGLKDLDIEMKILQVEMDLQNRPLDNKQISILEDQIIETLIERELLYQRALDRKLTIRPQWVKKALLEFKGKLANASLTLNDYLDQVDITELELRKRLSKGLIVRRLLRRDVMRNIKVRESEIRFYYKEHSDFFKREEQVRARHILVSLPENANGQQKENAFMRIRSIQDKIEKGSNFSILALERSNCPSRLRGGDLGFFSKDQVISPVSKQAFFLQPGQTSKIVITRYGYHLVQVVDRRPASPMAYKDTRKKIERTLRRNKEVAAARTYLSRLKKNASISYQDY
ncbi:MAG: hypothetical protein GY874_04150 [Desulfobacteraceae bacterium]|nr:hypothetical protein [Desulfobacteraceae bacterium]